MNILDNESVYMGVGVLVITGRSPFSGWRWSSVRSYVGDIPGCVEIAGNQRKTRVRDIMLNQSKYSIYNRFRFVGYLSIYLLCPLEVGKDHFFC